MALVYKNCIPSIGLPSYLCDPCSEGEKGRVSGVFFADASIKSELTAANLSLLSWWENKLATKSVIVIPAVRGTYDGGAQNKVTGFGRRKEILTGKTHTLVFNDKNHTGNHLFYAYLENNFKKFIPGWVTENELRVANNTLDSLEAKDAVEEDIDSLVLWQTTATWVQHQKDGSIPIVVDLSSVDDVKDLFDNCINVGGLPPIQDSVPVPAGVAMTKLTEGSQTTDVVSEVIVEYNYNIQGSGMTIAGSHPDVGFYLVFQSDGASFKFNKPVGAVWSDTQILNFSIFDALPSTPLTIFNERRGSLFKFRIISQHNPDGVIFDKPWIYEWDRALILNAED